MAVMAPARGGRDKEKERERLTMERGRQQQPVRPRPPCSGSYCRPKPVPAKLPRPPSPPHTPHTPRILLSPSHCRGGKIPSSGWGDLCTLTLEDSFYLVRAGGAMFQRGKRGFGFGGFSVQKKTAPPNQLGPAWSKPGSKHKTEDE